MMQSSSTVAVPSRHALTAVVSAWLLAGTLDIAAAVALTSYPLVSGAKVMRLLQGIASGILGAQAFAGGIATAALGLTLHYVIALIWTLIFFALFRGSKQLSRNAVLIGLAYGVVVWMVMNVIVLPLSNVRHAPFNLPQAIVGGVILMFCVGLPIALVAGRYYRTTLA